MQHIIYCIVLFNLQDIRIQYSLFIYEALRSYHQRITQYL